MTQEESYQREIQAKDALKKSNLPDIFSYRRAFFVGRRDALQWALDAYIKHTGVPAGLSGFCALLKAEIGRN